ncbi:hypothetical protein EYZ11_008797 [Aspergillus tanneri]|uniref:DUF6603 domain-containing protein n=1 Tax=Aspergillus tanneri TaxID=1220188 RepID=A0A4S3J9M3_9EURO|nr:uncharacterized protein ATNIH1004_005743 [Aspergillus tanneri]KAA8647060.1 hypothetical protein ATNIH1004_005743 [Aspergillus tanneri]THC91746.1 hypothetical protein EYZ11_008797 [Aspergillus tanneri]
MQSKISSLARPGRKTLQPKASPANNNFYIYSSDATIDPGKEHQVLTKGTPIDTFVSNLKDKVIILTAKPTAPDRVANFDASDKWLQWFSHLNTQPSGFVFSLKEDDQTNIQSFQFSFTAPWRVTFSSSSDALIYSFGPKTGSSPAQPRVPVPGINGKVLCCGLDPTQQGTLSGTIGDVLDFTKLKSLAASIPKAIVDSELRLNLSAAQNQRNALWLTPALGLETVMRLQFEFVNLAAVQQFLSDLFTIHTAGLVCNKVLGAFGTAEPPTVVDKSYVMFQMNCEIKPESHPSVMVIAGIKFQGSAMMVIFKPKSNDPLTGILAWLAQLSGVAQDVEGIFKESSAFEDTLKLRRVKLGFTIEAQTGKRTLNSFRADIEAQAKFGRDSNPVVFLISYTWSKGAGVGTLQGQLWTSQGDQQDWDLSPYYSEVEDLQPSISNPATGINLLKIVPGGDSIQNVPHYLPTAITYASITLSSKSLAIRATVKAQDTPPGPLPQPYLGQLTMDFSFTWGTQKSFALRFGILAGIKPSSASIHKDSATLVGFLSYDSKEQSWKVQADLQGLYASTLYDFFQPSAANHIMPLIESIEIAQLSLDYEYTKTPNAVGKSFTLSGAIYVADLELDLTFTYQTDWTFTATLSSQDMKVTLGDIIASILGDNALELPDFAADMQLDANKDKIIIDVKKDADSFQFIAQIHIESLELIFCQYHGADWESTIPSKRMLMAALTALPHISVPLVGDLTQPFDEMYVQWVQDGTKRNGNNNPAGLTRKEIKALNPSLGEKPLVPKDQFKDKTDSDVLVVAGSHFAVILKTSSGQRNCILDYAFAKPKEAAVYDRRMVSKHAETEEDDSDASSAHAPLKKKAGPLSISSIGFKYSQRALHIMFDATFELGPLGFTLIGFSIGLTIHNLTPALAGTPNIDGLSAAFEKAPLSIAGLIRHGSKGDLEYYSGGLIVGFTPYLFEAAGFYGLAKGQDPFKSVFIFARLEGPLVTLEFAEISGVTGGFGYNSTVRTPSIAEVVDFPFVATHTLDGHTGSALEALNRLTSPATGGWFSPLENNYWLAAGLKVDAFKMVTVDAVMVVQFGTAVKLGIFAVAVTDIPDASASLKFAHVELGIAVVLDLDYGLLKAEAQLSPNSYILDPNCHLTGGFGLCYWFDAPHADSSNTGNFVFTLGGYHQAFQVPASYPNPPRLGISWNLGANLSITGQAYFAITPKACMGGGRLHAAFSAGPIEAWFDAFADFLINYKPFHFLAEVGISVGVRINIDILFIHTSVSIEIGADLHLWGPPVAGRLHVHLWIASFDVNFGDSDSSTPPVDLAGFYDLVLQANSKTQSAKSHAPERGQVIDVSEPHVRPLNEGLVFRGQSGLMNKSDVPEVPANQPWVVRGGTFSFIISCTMAIDTATCNGQNLTYTTNQIYARPMHLTAPLSSTMTVSIQQGGASDDTVWGMDKYIKASPNALWGVYSPTTDPSGGNNHISALLNGNNATTPLMMGLQLTAPPPTLSPDKLPQFNIEQADLQRIPAEKPFPPCVPSHPEWEPDTAHGTSQWTEVRDHWATPDWSTGEDGQKGFVETWAKTFRWDSEFLSTLAPMPQTLKKDFLNLYVAAPLMTK